MVLYAGFMEYSVGTTHVINGASLISSVMEDTPLYRPSRMLWDNQMDSASDQRPPPDRRYIYHNSQSVSA